MYYIHIIRKIYNIHIIIYIYILNNIYIYLYFSLSLSTTSSSWINYLDLLKNFQTNLNTYKYLISRIVYVPLGKKKRIILSKSRRRSGWGPQQRWSTPSPCLCPAPKLPKANGQPVPSGVIKHGWTFQQTKRLMTSDGIWRKWVLNRTCVVGWLNPYHY